MQPELEYVQYHTTIPSKTQVTTVYLVYVTAKQMIVYS